MNTGLYNFLSASGKAIEMVPELYGDTVQPVAKESGKTFSLIPRTINAALVPLECWIEKRQYKLEETKKLLAIKLAHVGEEKIVSPDAYVAVPALQSISYSMDSHELRNLYANLLSRSMNIDTKNSVHPAFVETIKQLSPSDAILFQQLVSLPVLPIIDVQLKHDTTFSYIDLATNYNDFNKVSLSHEQFNLSLDNLIRQRLIEIPYGMSYSDVSHYKAIEAKALRKFPIKKYIRSYPNSSINLQRKRIDITSYGEHFHKICVID